MKSKLFHMQLFSEKQKTTWIMQSNPMFLIDWLIFQGSWMIIHAKVLTKQIKDTYFFCHSIMDFVFWRIFAGSFRLTKKTMKTWNPFSCFISVFKDDWLCFSCYMITKKERYLKDSKKLWYHDQFNAMQEDWCILFIFGLYLFFG